MCDWNLAKDWPNDPCTKPEDRPCRNAVSRSMGSGRDGHKVCEACYRRSKRLQRFKKNNRCVAGYHYVITSIRPDEKYFVDLERPEYQIMQETRAAGLPYEMPGTGLVPKQRRLHIWKE